MRAHAKSMGSPIICLLMNGTPFDPLISTAPTRKLPILSSVGGADVRHGNRIVAADQCLWSAPGAKPDVAGIHSGFPGGALSGDVIRVFGTGEQLRDMVFVDDVVDAFLMAGSRSIEGLPRDQAFNIGGPKPVSLTEIAQTAAEAAGSSSGIRFVPFPEQRRRIDIGSYYADSTRFHTWTGWEPRVELREGLKRTVAFYREHASKYPIARADSTPRSETSASRVLGAVAGGEAGRTARTQQLDSRS